ncbi:MAG: hypothetical protein M5U05_19180 [Anaerolineales bacterium]|nr:hypothetical protein [Anaerolineales bacterium]
MARDLVAHLGRLEDDRRVGRGRDFDLGLAVPTVSRRTRSNPQASRTAAAAVEVGAGPPACPRAAIDRMKTLESPAYDCIRTRSPSRAPPVIGLDGSTATTPTARPASRALAMIAETRVDLPDPGGPVMPTRWARPAFG